LLIGRADHAAALREADAMRSDLRIAVADQERAVRERDAARLQLADAQAARSAAEDACQDTEARCVLLGGESAAHSEQAAQLRAENESLQRRLTELQVGA
jgi:hypothetical protein